MHGVASGCAWGTACVHAFPRPGPTAKNPSKNHQAFPWVARSWSMPQDGGRRSMGTSLPPPDVSHGDPFLHLHPGETQVGSFPGSIVPPRVHSGTPLASSSHGPILPLSLS